MRRVRDRSCTKYSPPGSYTVHNSEGMLISGPHELSPKQYSIIDKIVDTAKVRRVQGLNNKFCSHSLAKQKLFPFTGNAWASTGTQYYAYNDANPGYPGGFPAVPELGQDASFNPRAFQAMQPSLNDNGLNLTNDLLEIADIKRLAPDILKVGELLRGGLNPRNRKVPCVEAVTEAIATGHITWSFGIRPLIGSVNGTLDVIRNYERKLRNFKLRSYQPQKRRYREVDEDAGWARQLEYSDANNRFYSVCEAKTTRVATMWFRYRVPNLDSTLAKFKALGDMLGLHLGVSQLWEALPYSFVVDWFFRIGDVLEQFDTPYIESITYVDDYVISGKIEHDLEVQWEYRLDGSGTWAPYHVVFTSQGKEYRRNRGLPDCGNTFVPQGGHYGLHQLALSASLLRLAGR